jgi:hypothetical protein
MRRRITAMIGVESRDGIIAAIHRGERGGGKAGVITVSGAAERRASRR